MQQLREINWEPREPDTWAKGEFLATIGSSIHDDLEIQAWMAQDIEKECWAKSADHYLGGGLEKGTPSIKQAERARKR